MICRHLKLLKREIDLKRLAENPPVSEELAEPEAKPTPAEGRRFL